MFRLTARTTPTPCPAKGRSALPPRAAERTPASDLNTAG
jgi:hypothetical protein